MEARTPTQRDADKRLFLSQLDDDVARANFERFGWFSPLNIKAIFVFWQEMDPEIFDGLGEGGDVGNQMKKDPGQ